MPLRFKSEVQQPPNKALIASRLQSFCEAQLAGDLTATEAGYTCS